MNGKDADERSETYRDRLTTDFTRILKSRFTSTVQPTDYAVELLVDSAMGAVDQLLDELHEERNGEARPSLAEVVARRQARSDTDPQWRTNYEGKS